MAENRAKGMGLRAWGMVIGSFDPKKMGRNADMTGREVPDQM